MAIPYKPDASESQAIRLLLVDAKVDLTRWLSYDFSSDFLTPTDSFSFVLGVGDGGLPERERAALKLGARVRLYVEHLILADGRIDAIEIAADRRGGTTYTIHGRDRLGQTLDAVVDPTFQLKSGGTLAEMLKRLFAPYGWSDDAHFAIDNEANRDARTGNRATPSRGKGGVELRKKKLASIVLHQTKPYNHESVFHFASRVAQRHGLWIWASADGETLIVGKPHFKQEPIFTLRRTANGESNVLSGSVRYDLTDQPSILMADSFNVGGSGEFGKGRSKAYVVNPLLGLTDEGENIPAVTALLAKHPGAVENTVPAASFAFRADGVPFRPLFLHDDESKTQEQLNAFVKREMSLLYRKALAAHYTVEGHGQTSDGAFVAWAPDTVVEVVDDVAGLHESLYVLGVHFSKSRAGTTTRLDLIRLHSIDF